MKNCVVMSLLTMRLALGYRGRNLLLEKMSVADKGSTAKDMPRIAAAAFPGRNMILISERFTEADFGPLPHSVDFLGKTIPDDLHQDAYIWAFAYGHEDDDREHMVVGKPVVYGDTYLSWAIGVQIGQGAIAKAQDLDLILKSRAENDRSFVYGDDSFWHEITVLIEELEVRIEAGKRFGDPIKLEAEMAKIAKSRQLQPSRIVKGMREGAIFIDDPEPRRGWE